MKPLDLRRLSRAAEGRSLRVFLDFDGTLSRHRLDGSRSALMPQARAALEALVRRPDARVVVVSARPVGDLRRRVRVAGVTLAGNHGLEIAGELDDFKHPLSAVAAHAVAAAAGLLRSRLAGHRGVEISQDGLSMSLNIGRSTPAGRRRAAQVVASSAAEMRWLSLRWEEGHLGWNLIPEVGWGKGDVVRHLLRGSPGALAVAVGDGLTDEPMFEAVGRGGVSVRVGRARRSKARYFVRGISDVARLLRAMLSI